MNDKAEEIDEEFLALSARQDELKRTIEVENVWLKRKQAEHEELAKVLF